LPLTAVERSAIPAGRTIIYVIFIGDFLPPLMVAPRKGRFLRRNMLIALSVLLPLLRPIHLLGGIARLSTGQLLQAVTGTKRLLQAVHQITLGARFAYLLSLTVILVLLASVAVYLLERHTPSADIDSLGEALWWAATLVTMINSADDPVTLPGRVVGMALRLYALTVFGYLTASISTYIVGQRPSPLAPR